MGDHGMDMAPPELEAAADDAPPLLREIYPDLCTEPVGLLNAEGLSGLGVCAHDLRIVAPCRCADDFCRSFHTAPPPNGPYGPGHRNVTLDPEQGMIILDVVDDRIMFVEVLDHPPLRDASQKPPTS